MPEGSDNYQKLGNLWESDRLEVPSYQRRYSWKEEQIQDLINDLDYVREEDARRDEDGEIVTHYFGTIVLDHQGSADLPEMAGTTWKQMDIVDGQQRILSVTILIGLLVELIENLAGELEEDQSEMAGRVGESLEESYIEDLNTRRTYISNDDDWNVFKSIVYDQRAPEEYRQLNDPSLPSQERLLQSKEVFRDWIVEGILIDEILGGNDDVQDAYQSLKSGETDIIEDNRLDIDGSLRVLNKLTQDEIEEFVHEIIDLREFISERFLTTQYKVEASSEAGRIFQSINDRGRDLMMADRIKSYLIYMADRMDEPGLAEDIFDAFADVADTITEYNDEQEIDEFIRAHWRMWTGETRYRRSSTYDETPNDVHRRIKQLEKHASLSRDESDRKNWIEEYVEDLRRSASAYIKIINPQEFDPDTFSDDLGTDTQRKIEGIHRCSSIQNVRSILMAVYRLYARHPPGLTERELNEIVSLLENMAFRVYGAADKKANVRRDKYRDLSHRLRWTGQADELDGLFGTSNNSYEGTTDVKLDDIFADRAEAVTKTCRAIENAIGNYGYDLLLINGLLHDDILDGNRDTDNWNGMKKDAVRHFLWEYEFYLREDEDVGDMPSLRAIKQEQRDIEHIWAQNRDEHLPDELAAEHEQHVNSLGNLGLLHYSSNRGAKDDSYEIKYDEIYYDSRMDHLRALPAPDDAEEFPWRREQIVDRRRDLLKFAKDRWATKSYATIRVADADDIGRETREALIEKIRNDFGGYEEEINRGNIPRVEIKDASTGEEGEIEKHACECGGTTLRVVEANSDDQGMSIECNDCGEEFSVPPYFFTPQNYAEQAAD
jgi:uncharacterized protein with ParB-like and HNH nuclease domain